MIKTLFFLSLTLLSCSLLAASVDVDLKTPNIDIQDTESQKRGFVVFLEYCQGCHSARFMRYGRVASDLGIDPETMKEYIKDGSKIHDEIKSIAPAQALEDFFGVAPPDLSLEARYRGEDWLYSYLLGFYPDETTNFSYNNSVMPRVNMPWVLNYQQTHDSPEQFESKIADLTNFMAYMAEPIRPYREAAGKWVILFLLILLIPVYMLKQSYWKHLAH